MEGEAAADPCAICLGDVGRGQAIFTAECSHVFHNRCISASVAYGHRDCPLCKAAWRDLPASVEAVQDEARAADHAVVALRTHCERPAVAGGASRGSFAVLVHAVAPGAAAAGAQCAPLDLVTVIDLSGSMRGQKLYLVKQAVGFVIDNLGPADRLSVVSFSNDATSVVRLARMTARREWRHEHRRGPPRGRQGAGRPPVRECRHQYDPSVRRAGRPLPGDDAAVLRPPEVPDGDAEPSMEVERERVRVTATEDIAAARAAAERGEHAEAARILEGGQEAVRRSAPGMAGDPTCAALEDELGDLGARAANRMEYEQTGRAAMLAGMSSHRQQRALSVAVRPAQFGLRVRGRGARRRYGGRGGGAAPRPYVNPAMQNMVKISRSARGQQQRTSSPAPPAKRMHLRFAE
ncbi:hypothetical protein C2845_PM02G12320 [Panicum miliaceum]|uniref:RING-type domain-containing protein n=1 Tax=Panicum miliaceum TaxID=4540 RepID=A0A3L6SA73_PANMI|nr:hypothetical protein C2845_PM02G12320 [Panicum miliaceum]